MSSSRLPAVMAWLFTTVAVASGLSIASWLRSRRAVAESKAMWILERVVGASRDLPPGTKLTASDLTISQLPMHLLMTAHLAPRDELLSLDQPLTFGLHSGELVTRAHFGPRVKVDTCVPEVRNLALGGRNEDQRWHALLELLARERAARRE